MAVSEGRTAMQLVPSLFATGGVFLNIVAAEICFWGMIPQQQCVGEESAHYKLCTVPSTPHRLSMFGSHAMKRTGFAGKEITLWAFQRDSVGSCNHSGHPST